MKKVNCKSVLKCLMCNTLNHIDNDNCIRCDIQFIRSEYDTDCEHEFVPFIGNIEICIRCDDCRTLKCDKCGENERVDDSDLCEECNNENN